MNKKLKKLVKYSRMSKTDSQIFFGLVLSAADTLIRKDEQDVLVFLLHCQPSSKGKYFYLRNNHIFFQELFAAQNPRKILIALDKIVAVRVLIRMNQLEQQREQVTGVSSDYWRSYVWKAMVGFVEKAAYCGQIRCVPRPIFPTHRIFRFHIRIYHLQGRMSRFFSLKMSKKQRHRLLNTVALIDIIFRRFTLGKI
jgi:hypothetical protein